MKSELHCRDTTRIFWLVSFLVCVVGANQMSHDQTALRVSAPHLSYTCPAGAKAKLVCARNGAKLHPDDVLHQHWLFNPDSGQHCHEGLGPRNTSHGKHTSAGLSYGSGEHSFWVVLENVTSADQGRYCCVALDVQIEHKTGIILQKPHSHLVLHVTPRRNGSQDCTFSDSQPHETGSVSAALATVACIVALLSLPLIMVLVYKQRINTHHSKRAHELVRMDSEALGHENPVFQRGSPQPKTRTVSQIMTRQSSETGRHLLSEPGTPLSPNMHGDVFFPAQEPIPESPDFIGV